MAVPRPQRRGQNPAYRPSGYSAPFDGSLRAVGVYVMMSLQLAVVGALVVAAVAGAQTPPSPAMATAQQMFDAGEDALAAGKYAQAVEIFRALEAKLAARHAPTARSLAVARLRLGQSLIGTRDEAGAIAPLNSALPGLSATNDLPLRREGLQDLARAEEISFDLTAAAAHYREALALTPATEEKRRVVLRTNAARSGMFDDPGAVAADLQAALPEAERAFPRDKDALSQYWTIYGRALLNAHQNKPAVAALKKALDLTGGLNFKVTLNQLSVRADSALAAAISGNADQAAMFTAYTGAGRDEKNALTIPLDADPPSCGGVADIHPDDVAVVQFGLGEDGAVSGVTPVYASRPGPMAAAFAEAVAGWSWTPTEARKINLFFRLTPRLELRCTTKADRKSAGDLLDGDVRNWLAQQGADTVPFKTTGASDGRYAARVQMLRARLADAERVDGPTSARLLPFLMALSDNPALNTEERRAAVARSARIADAARAPLAVRAFFAVGEIGMKAKNNWYADARRRARELDTIADAPRFAADTRVRGWLLLMASEALAEAHDRARARARLEELATLRGAGFAANDPIHQAASIRLASSQAAEGARAAATATFAKSGLDPSQCALLDATPQSTSRTYSADDFPERARSLGFEGWAVAEFDIRANGHTANPRAVIVYPPFLFGDASSKIVARSTYRPSFRPDGALSCGGYRDRVKYKL